MALRAYCSQRATGYKKAADRPELQVLKSAKARCLPGKNSVIGHWKSQFLLLQPLEL